MSEPDHGEGAPEIEALDVALERALESDPGPLGEPASALAAEAARAARAAVELVSCEPEPGSVGQPEPANEPGPLEQVELASDSGPSGDPEPNSEPGPGLDPVHRDELARLRERLEESLRENATLRARLDQVAPRTRRLGPGRRAAVDPREVLDEVVGSRASRAAQAGVDLVTSVAAGVPRRISQRGALPPMVLQELVDNALRHTAQGKVELTLDLDRLEAHGVRLRIRVRDTGEGVADEARPRIKARLAGEDGAGGLGRSAAALAGLSAELGYESRAGAGTSFWVAWQAPWPGSGLPGVSAPVRERDSLPPSAPPVQPALVSPDPARFDPADLVAQVGNDRRALVSVVHAFADDADDHRAAMQSCLEGGDPKGLKAVAWELTAMATNVGARAIAACGARLARKQDALGAEAAVAELEVLCDEIRWLAEFGMSLGLELATGSEEEPG